MRRVLLRKRVNNRRAFEIFFLPRAKIVNINEILPRNRERVGSRRKFGSLMMSASKLKRDLPGVREL